MVRFRPVACALIVTTLGCAGGESADSNDGVDVGDSGAATDDAPLACRLIEGDTRRRFEDVPQPYATDLEELQLEVLVFGHETVPEIVYTNPWGRQAVATHGPWQLTSLLKAMPSTHRFAVEDTDLSCALAVDPSWACSLEVTPAAGTCITELEFTATTDCELVTMQYESPADGMVSIASQVANGAATFSIPVPEPADSTSFHATFYAWIGPDVRGETLPATWTLDTVVPLCP